MLKEKHILIVDDDLEVLQQSLKMIHEFSSTYSVMTSKSGEKALEIAKARVPDIIITDWYMPEMNGIELIKALKAHHSTKDIPIIMTTGVRLSPEDLSAALEAGAVDYIRKPIIKVELQARVNSALLLSQSWKDALKVKDAELNANALQLAKNNEFMKGVQDYLADLQKSKDAIEDTLQSLNSEINVHLKVNAWDKFETSFQSLHSDFNQRLLDNYPNLSPKDLKLCALVMLGMSTKDIASVFSISEDSVKVSRYRLRKKFNFSEKENLQTFLMQI